MGKEIRTVYDLLRQSKEAVGASQTLVLPTVFPPPVSLPEGADRKSIEDAEFKPKPQTNPEPLVASQAEASAAVEGRTKSLVGEVVRYVLIFGVSFGFFYFFLNFGAFSSKIVAYFHSTPVEPQTQGTVLGVATPEYSAWMRKYFYQTNNADALSPNYDFDRDGLTNYEEFLLGTNPTKTDTDNDGYGDGQEVLNGYNPLYSGKLTPDQVQLTSEWDQRDINNRLSFYALSKLPVGPAKPGADPSVAPTAQYDLSTPGEVNIPKLGIKAPLNWSTSEQNFVADLENGPIHYPGTALPGESGVSYISGHSSNYVWSTSKYSYVFSRINELKPGDEFFITVYKKDGSKLSFRYVVTGQAEYKPDDQAQFNGSGGESLVNLSTCWPLGSTANRIVVTGKLTGV